MGSSQIWPCHVTQAKNLSFPYLKSYCSLNFNGSYKENNLKEGRICPPPPPPMWNASKNKETMTTFHFLSCRDIKITIMTSYFGIRDKGIFFFISQDFYPLRIPTKFQHHLTRFRKKKLKNLPLIMFLAKHSPPPPITWLP